MPLAGIPGEQRIDRSLRQLIAERPLRQGRDSAKAANRFTSALARASASGASSTAKNGDMNPKDGWMRRQWRRR